MAHSKLAREEVDPIEDDGEVAEPVTTVDTTKLVHLDDETPFDPTRDVTKQFTLEALAAMDGLDWDLHECSTMPGEESEPLAVERDRRNPPAAGAEMPRSAGSATGLRPHLAPLAEATHRDPLSAVRRVRRPSARRVRVVVRPWRRVRPSLVVRQAPTPFACAAGALSRANGATTVTDAGVGATTVRIDSKTEAFGIAAVAKWLAVSALLLSAVFGGARLEQARSRALANALASAPSGSVVGASPAPLVDTEAMASAEGAGASTPSPAETPSASSVASAASAPSGYRPPALDRHSGPLERAKQRLAVGDAVGALRQVDDYDRFYRRGPLAPESTSVRVEALLLQGNADAAIHLADRFLAANPKSPYAAHIRLLVEHARTP